MRNVLPWWLTIIIVLETLPMFVGPVLSFLNPQFLGGPGIEEVHQAHYIYAARNFAVGFAFLIAFVMRSAPMLFILIIVRLATDLVDLPAFMIFDMSSNPPVTIASFVFLYYIPALVALRYLWTQIRMEQTRGA